MFHDMAKTLTILDNFLAPFFKLRTTSTWNRNGRGRILTPNPTQPFMLGVLIFSFFSPCGCSQFGLVATPFHSAMQTDGKALCTHKLRIKIPLGSYSGLSSIPKRTLHHIFPSSPKRAQTTVCRPRKDEERDRGDTLSWIIHDFRQVRLMEYKYICVQNLCFCL